MDAQRLRAVDALVLDCLDLAGATPRRRLEKLARRNLRNDLPVIDFLLAGALLSRHDAGTKVYAAHNPLIDPVLYRLLQSLIPESAKDYLEIIPVAMQGKGGFVDLHDRYPVIFINEQEIFLAVALAPLMQDLYLCMRSALRDKEGGSPIAGVDFSSDPADAARYMTAVINMLSQEEDPLAHLYVNIPHCIALYLKEALAGKSCRNWCAQGEFDDEGGLYFLNVLTDRQKIAATQSEIEWHARFVLSYLAVIVGHEYQHIALAHATSRESELSKLFHGESQTSIEAFQEMEADTLQILYWRELCKQLGFASVSAESVCGHISFNVSTCMIAILDLISRNWRMDFDPDEQPGSFDGVLFLGQDLAVRDIVGSYPSEFERLGNNTMALFMMLYAEAVENAIDVEQYIYVISGIFHAMFESADAIRENWLECGDCHLLHPFYGATELETRIQRYRTAKQANQAAARQIGEFQQRLEQLAKRNPDQTDAAREFLRQVDHRWIEEVLGEWAAKCWYEFTKQ